MLPEDKPTSLSIKDYIIKKMSVKMRTSESIIEKVIDNQFVELTTAMITHNSAELSGFGTFLFLQNKAIKYVAKLQEELRRREAGEKPSLSMNTESVEKAIIELSKKINHVYTPHTADC